MHRYMRPAEIVAAATIASAFFLRAALPLAVTATASLQPPIGVQVKQTTLPQEFKPLERCDPGKLPTAWGAWLVPVDTKCLETAKEVAVVFRGPMHYKKSGEFFFREVGNAMKRKAKIVLVRFNSPGGDMDSGLAIGRWLRANKSVRIEIPEWCASACAIAVLGAGPGRITLKTGAEIAVHQAYDADTGLILHAMTTKAARDLQSLGLPATVAAGLVNTSPEDSYVLTGAEYKAYGITQEGKST